MGRQARQLTEFYRDISGDIFKLCRALNFTPTNQQIEFLTAVQRGDRRIACKSGQGPGKTTSACIAAFYRILWAVNAMCVVTAPTMRQCRDVFLAECRRLLENADPRLRQLIKVTKTKIEVAGVPDWGVKTVTATKEENAQGFHETNMTVICEEASGIDRPIITQFKGTLSNQNAMLILIGNPNTRDCAFFDCFNSQRAQWTTMTFNAEETARDYPHIVDPRRNQELEEEFGRESDVYRVRVLGQFPFADPNCVMSSEDVERCTDINTMYRMAMLARAEEYGGGLAKQFGLDFARFGSDESTIYRRSGNAIVEWERFAHTDPSIVVDRSIRMQSDAGWSNEEAWFVADAGGMGQGVMHLFYEREKRLLEFHNGGKALLQDYKNKVTEAYFHVAKLVKKGRCYLPKDNVLIQQLTGRRYFTDKKGKLVLESKEEYMKRVEGSPDRADGCVMAFYDQVEAVGNISDSVDGRKAGIVVR